MVAVVEPGQAARIANDNRLTIYQKWGQVKDCLTPFLCGKLTDEQASVAEWASQPTVYYAVREDETYWYVFNLLYHTFDYSTSTWSIIQKWDSHRHDTEGVLLRVSKETNVADICTVAHSSFFFRRNSDRRVHVEKGSHAIRPFDAGLVKDDANYLIYKKYDLVNLLSIDPKRWEEIKAEFRLSGVSAPEDQSDNILRLMTVNRRHKHLIGDIWYRPDMVFIVAEETNRM